MSQAETAEAAQLIYNKYIKSNDGKLTIEILFKCKVKTINKFFEDYYRELNDSQKEILINALLNYSGAPAQRVILLNIASVLIDCNDKRAYKVIMRYYNLNSINVNNIDKHTKSFKSKILDVVKNKIFKIYIDDNSIEKISYFIYYTLKNTDNDKLKNEYINWVEKNNLAKHYDKSDTKESIAATEKIEKTNHKNKFDEKKKKIVNIEMYTADNINYVEEQYATINQAVSNNNELLEHIQSSITLLSNKVTEYSKNADIQRALVDSKDREILNLKSKLNEINKQSDERFIKVRNELNIANEQIKNFNDMDLQNKNKIEELQRKLDKAYLDFDIEVEQSMLTYKNDILKMLSLDYDDFKNVQKQNNPNDYKMAISILDSVFKTLKRKGIKFEENE